MAEIQLIDASSLPKCPYCLKELDKIETTKKSYTEQHTIYNCYYCKKVLSIAINL